jgi:probable addiction module antidote protein
MKTKSFDIAEHLGTLEDIQEFLKEVDDTGDEADYVHALSIAARAYGMTKVAKEAGVTRASLYKSLAPGGNPHFKTISRVTKVFGLRMKAA